MYAFFNLPDDFIREVTEPSLKLDIFLDGLQFREINVQAILPPLHLIKRKDTRLRGQPAQLDGQLWRRSPPRGTDGGDVDIGRTLNTRCLLFLLNEIKGITRTGRGNIRNIMGCCYSRHILLPCDLP